MNELVYEFQSVSSRDGENKMTSEHANPVYILVASVGVSARLEYVDKPNVGIVTSTVESVFIHGHMVNIRTKNTDYWLEPHIRERRN